MAAKDVILPTSSAASFAVVGVGASAGGLEALEVLFNNMPADTGMAFVVIQHLSPDFKSLMDELLSRHTTISIHRVEDGMAVEPDAIYLIPPKKEMIISGGRLLLSDKDPTVGFSLPIDTFFRSLAQDVGERAMGVILSGTGSDGSRGIRAIHEAGGLVVVQSEETAKFDGMPRSAIETGVADFIVAPGEIPGTLLRHIKHPVHGNPLDKDTSLSETGLTGLYGLLRAECGIDFSFYKPNTVLRRIERRLQMNRSMDLEEYIEQLRNDPIELNLLYKDLLIGVTRFFRDPDLFRRLEHVVIPEVLSKVPSDEEIRVWIAGCATGEEPYSIAILLHEAIADARRPLNVRVFATDVHRASLDFASAGVYSDSALSEVSEERLKRFFVRHGNSYQVSQDLRKSIVFAPHNVIKDAPFTKLDLVSCRNLLIYFQPPAQRKALSLFHFGLKAGGTLVLGPSETPGEIGDEFETVDSHWRIYRKRRDIRLPADLRMPLTPLAMQAPTMGSPVRGGRPGTPDASLIKAYDELLSAYVPASVLVNERREVVHAFAGAGKFLSVPDGRPSNDLLDMVDKDLRLAISSVMQRAAKESATVAYAGVIHRDLDGESRIKVCARPLPLRASAETFFLISFECEDRSPAPEPALHLDLDVVTRRRMVDLEDELRYTKENLQAAIEEMETTNEELQATNEELLASNEELQSTNEELHSVNEELYTVNAEYQRKITELTELTDDMDNLLRSTEVGTIFLDREFTIRKFTPRIAHAFHLLPQDVGRRIDSFAYNLLHKSLLDDVKKVLESEMPFEEDVQDRFGQWFLLRILPYRSKGKVEGVVLTLIDISRLKETEKELRRLSKVFMDGADPIIIEDLSGRIIEFNREASRAYGWPREELLGKNITALAPPEYVEHEKALRSFCFANESVRNVETLRVDRSGKACPVLITLSLLNDEAGKPTAIATIAKDISVQKRAEEDARDAARRRDQFLAMLSHELRNPLGAILNSTRLLEHVDSNQSAIDRAHAIIGRQAKHMARLLDDLLDVARLTQGKIQVRRAVIDLRPVVEEAVQVAQAVIDTREHALTTHLPDEPVYVDGDAARLLQVLENLLGNAAKYTPPGGKIRLSLEAKDGEAVVRVRDNGEGIAPEMHRRVFEPFVQVNQTLHRSDGGIGVGLSVAQTIIALHGGRICVQSEGVGHGSEFEIALPLSANEPAKKDEAPVQSDQDLKVVIVEDNADSREMLAALLRIEGHEVAMAADGVAGFETIVAEKPDVALIDIGLPGMSGYEVARRVRAMFDGTPIRLVALTGYGRPEDRDAVIDAGFNEHLVKPVHPLDLAKALKKPR